MVSLDFVIIGLPKAGTSSLFNWLNAHPQIQGSNPKETFFFMDSEHPLVREEANYNIQGMNAYEQYFPDPKNGRVRFEATTHYFYQKTALEFFTQSVLQPQIIFVLRQPSERIHSSFRFTQENLANMNRKLTFNEYVEHLLKKDMAPLKQYFYSEGSYFAACQELEFSKYVNWLDQWSKHLSAEKMHVILFEDIKGNPKNVVKNICNKLDIDSGFYNDFSFKADNQTISINNQGLHRLARKWGSKFPSGEIKQLAKKFYYQLQQEKSTQERDTWSEGLKQLNEFFQPWNAELKQKYNLSFDNSEDIN